MKPKKPTFQLINGMNDMRRTKGSKNKQYVPSDEQVGTEAPKFEATPPDAAPTSTQLGVPLNDMTKEDESENERWARIKERRDAAKEARSNSGALGEQKLVAPTREGFYRRWINDDGNRLADKLNKGYDFVRKGSAGTENVFTTDPGDRISQLVGLTKTNDPMRAYLMEIPEGWRNEDQEQREDRRRVQDEQLKRAAVGGNKGIGSSNAYIPNKGPSHFDA